nr:MAG TPA: lipoprotein [Caudoviricetes sp.]
MKKIITMSLAFMMIVMMAGCAQKKTPEVAPAAPPIETDITVEMVQKCDELLEEAFGDRVLTEIVDGRYQVVIAEPGLTTEVIYLSGLSKSYDDLCIACKKAVGMDAVVGICDTSGTLIYVSLNGEDITSSVS